MKSVKLYVILAFALIAIFGVYCRKNVGPTDLYLKPDPFPSEQSLIISAINYETKDSISGFSINVTGPSGTNDFTATGNTYKLPLLKDGTYTIKITKTGFLPGISTVSILLPTETNYSFYGKESILMTKSAPSVTVTSSSGAIIPVFDSQKAGSPQEARLEVPANNTITVNGTVQSSINITATYIPKEVGKPKLSKDRVVLKSLDLQPDGAKFAKPIRVGIFVSDLLPFVTDKWKLTVIFGGDTSSVKSFSSKNDTAYFDVSHFTTAIVINRDITVTTAQNYKGGFYYETPCSEGVTETFNLNITIPATIAQNYFQSNAAFSQTVSIPAYKPAVKQYRIWVIGAFLTTSIRLKYLKDESVGEIQNGIFKIKYGLNPCHNQGGK